MENINNNARLTGLLLKTKYVLYKCKVVMIIGWLSFFPAFSLEKSQGYLLSEQISFSVYKYFSF